MGATERVVVLMTPDQKARAKARADASKLGLGEYMRRQTFQENRNADDAMLRALVNELNASTARAARALDATIHKLDAMQGGRADFEAKAHKRAMREFSSVDPAVMATLLRGRTPA